MAAGPICQADLDKLDKAIVLGVQRVTYTSGTVEYRNMDDMMKARAHAAALLGVGDTKQGMSSLVVFCRD